MQEMGSLRSWAEAPEEGEERLDVSPPAPVRGEEVLNRFVEGDLLAQLPLQLGRDGEELLLHPLLDLDGGQRKPVISIGVMEALRLA